MIHAEKGNVRLEGDTKDIVDELTFAIAQVLRIAKCRDRKKLMNIMLNISSNAIDIVEEIEKEKGAENDSV